MTTSKPNPADATVDLPATLERHLPFILGRTEPIGQLTEAHKSFVASNRVLITGAAGSIGSALSELILELGAEVLLLDNHENSLFRLRDKLRPKFDTRAQFVMADVRNATRMHRILDGFRPTIVYHLAAYKHVPLAEEFPQEFVVANVLATAALARMCMDLAVVEFVYSSTDKAVQPPSVYGATKRASELVLGEMSRQTTKTHFTVARLVNVVGARGGVIESFAQAIAANRPLTITDARMTRYWITMADALFLLVGATCRDRSGTVLLDLGPAVGIVDIALRVQQALAGISDPSKIEYIGIRAGERLDEELTYPYESLSPSSVRGLLEVTASPIGDHGRQGRLGLDLSALARSVESGSSENVRSTLFSFISLDRPSE